MERKGQMWSFDLALSLMIFLSAMITVLFAWGYISNDVMETRTVRDMQLKAMTLSDSLIRTPGIPSGWNESTVQVIGLASDDNVISPEKLSSFLSLNHSTARAMLDINPYDFYIEIRDINGTLYANTSATYGSGDMAVVPVERYVIYGGRIARLRFVLWG